MKRSKLELKPGGGTDFRQQELVYSFNEKPIAVIPLPDDDDTLNAAMYLVLAYNNAQPEE